MRDRVIHRLSRGLRLIMGMSVMLQGIFVPGRTSLARAAASDTMRIGMTPGSFKPPDAATGMLASANPSVEGLISLTWSSPQGVAGGTPIANQTVANYIVEYATFSVDDLAGDTTA